MGKVQDHWNKTADKHWLQTFFMIKWPQDRWAENHRLKSFTELPNIKVHQPFYPEEKSLKGLHTPGFCYWKVEINY